MADSQHLKKTYLGDLTFPPFEQPIFAAGSQPFLLLNLNIWLRMVGPKPVLNEKCATLNICRENVKMVCLVGT